MPCWERTPVTVTAAMRRPEAEVRGCCQMFESEFMECSFCGWGGRGGWFPNVAPKNWAKDGTPGFIVKEAKARSLLRLRNTSDADSEAPKRKPFCPIRVAGGQKGCVGM